MLYMWQQNFRTITLLWSVIFLTPTLVFSHSFLTSPHPISSIDGCRIGGSGGFIGDCPGPCPNYNIAADADPSNPTATFHRGGYHRVVWSRNNHEGGFSRWTLVPIDKMNSKDWHAKMAFHYTCWNIGRFNCNEFDFHRDCNYDRKNEAFSKMLYIPPIYPDGIYVLGFTWFGGGEGTGHFGDYYDCAYVRIRGGQPLEKSFRPDFIAGGGSPYEDGCEATVDQLGVCWKEPCLPLRKTRKMVPEPFKDGRLPEPIYSEWFRDVAADLPSSVQFLGIKLVDAIEDRILEANLNEIVLLNREDEISLLTLTEGDVDYVEWYTNGKLNGRDYDLPFSIAGDSGNDFYPWMHPMFNRRIRITVKVVGRDKSFCWGNIELRFQETAAQGASRTEGKVWDQFVSTINDISGTIPELSLQSPGGIDKQNDSGTRKAEESIISGEVISNTEEIGISSPINSEPFLENPVGSKRGDSESNISTRNNVQVETEEEKLRWAVSKFS